MNIIEHIKATNKAFEEATPEQKRVIIAKDVLLRIELDLITAETGSLIHVESIDTTYTFKTPAKQIVNNNNCQVCAKGALFCAFVGRVNKASMKEMLDNPNDKKSASNLKIMEVFEPEQVDLIEIAFEGVSYLGISYDRDANERASDFHCEYDEPNERLIAICNNIIENNGTFIP